MDFETYLKESSMVHSNRAKSFLSRFADNLSVISEGAMHSPMLGDTYRARVDSRFSHGMSSILGGNVVEEDSNLKYTIQLTNFPRLSYKKAYKGFWLTLNNFRPRSLGSNGDYYRVEYSIDVSLLYNKEALFSIWKAIEDKSLSIDWNTLSIATWPSNLALSEVPWVVTASVQTSARSRIAFDLLVATAPPINGIYPFKEIELVEHASFRFEKIIAANMSMSNY